MLQYWPVVRFVLYMAVGDLNILPPFIVLSIGCSLSRLTKLLNISFVRQDQFRPCGEI